MPQLVRTDAAPDRRREGFTSRFDPAGDRSLRAQRRDRVDAGSAERRQARGQHAGNRDAREADGIRRRIVDAHVAPDVERPWQRQQSAREHAGQADAIFRIDPATGAAQSLGVDEKGLVGKVAISSDGEWLYYRRFDEPPTGRPGTVVARRHLPTGRTVELYRQRGREIAGFALSPDDRWLAFRVTNTDGTRSLELMSSSGGSVSTILRDEMSEVSWGGGMFAWSPDSRYVFVVRGPRDRSRDEAALGVWRVPVSGDSPVRLAMRAGVCAGTAIPAVALTLMACASAPLGVRAPAARQIPVGLDLYMPVPSDNPMTAEKIALGQQLFFDRRLSRDGTLSCSSCHDPAHAFADRRTVSVGIGGRRGRRNVPTLVNRGYGRAFSWDGRAPSLEAQVLEPIANPVELGMPIAGLL